MIARSWLVGLATVGTVFATLPAQAQDADSGSDNAAQTAEVGAASQDEPTEEAGSKADARDDKDADAAAPADPEASPVEERGKTYQFVGARYRLIVVPKFIIGLFADGGTTVPVHSFGPEFGIRKDGFEYNFALTYAPYSMDPTPFKATDDGEDAWELVESKVKVLYLTADFLWSHSFSPEFALNYGMGAGLGLVFGPLYRNQAFRSGDGFERCAAAGDPRAPAGYCGNDNDHYNNYEEPSWADGGSKPVIFPWLAVQSGFRYKPHRNFAARFDLGFGLSGFFFGVGADYGL